MHRNDSRGPMTKMIYSCQSWRYGSLVMYRDAACITTGGGSSSDDLRDVSVVVYPNYVTQDSGLALLQDCAWNSHESGEGTVASLFLNAYRDFEENQVLEAGAGTRDFMAQRLAVIDWNPCIGPNGQWPGTKRYNAAVNIAETFMPQFRAELLARLDEIRGEGAPEITEIVASPRTTSSMARCGIIEADGSSQCLRNPVYTRHPDHYTKYSYPKKQDTNYKVLLFLDDLALRRGAPSFQGFYPKHVPKLDFAESFKTRLRAAVPDELKREFDLRREYGVAALHDDPDRHAEWYQNIVKARVEIGKRQTELRRKVKDREVESTEDERALYEHICGSENAAKEKAKSERLEAFKVDKSDGLYCYCANKSCKDQLKIVVVDQIKLSKVEEIVGKGKELFGVVPSNSTPVQTSYASGPKSGEKISVHCSYADAFEELLDLKLPEGKPKTTKAGKSSSFDECTEAYGRKVRKGTPQIISLVDENGKETCNVQISLYEIKRSSELSTKSKMKLQQRKSSNLASDTSGFSFFLTRSTRLARLWSTLRFKISEGRQDQDTSTPLPRHLVMCYLLPGRPRTRVH